MVLAVEVLCFRLWWLCRVFSLASSKYSSVCVGFWFPRASTKPFDETELSALPPLKWWAYVIATPCSFTILVFEKTSFRCPLAAVDLELRSSRTPEAPELRAMRAESSDVVSLCVWTVLPLKFLLSRLPASWNSILLLVKGF